MTKEQVYNLIQEGIDPTPSDIDRLGELVNDYPCFDAAKLLYLKALYEHNTELFKTELPKLSPLIKNRETLFYYIFRDEYARYFKASGNKKLKEDRTQKLLNTFFDDQEPEALFLDFEAPQNNLVSVDYLSYLQEETEQKTKVSPRKEKDLKKLIYIENEEEEITENKAEIKEKKPLLEFELSEEQDEEVADTSTPLNHQNLIDRFIEDSKKSDFSILLDKKEIKKDKDYVAEEKENSDADLNEDVFFTETLAKIYIKQGRFEKAYKIIEHLSLNYPKKNSYFADQLRYLEILIINSKHRNKK